MERKRTVKARPPMSIGGLEIGVSIMDIRALVFDMDGTLLDTLPDLAVAANKALAHMGYPERPLCEMAAHMGLGGRHLIESILPAGVTADETQRIFELWRDLYISSSYELTKPYDGVIDTLRELRARGVKTAVLSNKFDAGVHALVATHFPGLFDIVRGDLPPMPRKPDPTALKSVIANLNVCARETVYVGDSIVDAKTARNAGVRFVGVAWGYDQAAPLPLAQLDAYIAHPNELLPQNEPDGQLI